MPAARRKGAAFVTAGVVGAAPFAPTVCAAGSAAAHGSPGDPVSRVAQCYAEGPENNGGDASGGWSAPVRGRASPGRVGAA
ncbi:hypothetical protein [Streptomyces sp. MA5143a]|uniref:hypothetical protein n=1 Tax=Streptomyces sp. MA5143a TaxID=2083010 RepID=UPI000D2A6FF2|nr:hypothetical protein SMA5143A_2185 [Streptomyces sp. MA5143a]